LRPRTSFHYYTSGRKSEISKSFLIVVGLQQEHRYLIFGNAGKGHME